MEYFADGYYNSRTGEHSEQPSTSIHVDSVKQAFGYDTQHTNKINAIKSLRGWYDMGLSTAKVIVEHWMANNPPEKPQVPVFQVGDFVRVKADPDNRCWSACVSYCHGLYGRVVGESDGSVAYPVEFAQRFDGGHDNSGQTREGHGQWVDVRDLEAVE